MVYRVCHQTLEILILEKDYWEEGVKSRFEVNGTREEDGGPVYMILKVKDPQE